ncbi:hypothetical protein G6O67_001073 [Ophiocordyceps sinensis]|uniref:Alpha-1,2-mannosyltransferase n=1 Tax=Ophiocordyceps sinensis TaxID=72228 RepID=A0A8H4PWQ1_9HYPO|nr:hypothetical protein G6O67_001073 [Ophiocordyceps sinensis]
MRLRRVRHALFARSPPALEPDRKRLAPRSSHGRQFLRGLARHWKLVLGVALLVSLEQLAHVWSFVVPRPRTSLDPPFHVGCQEPVLNTSTRARAAFVMLARNSDVVGAEASVRSVQDQFNRHFGYPWVFFNDKPWSDDFVARLGRVVSEGGAEATFETIPAYMWGYPSWINQTRARQSMSDMERRGILYGGEESYHHMCRFNSGFFFDHPALQQYKWYWRVEPDIEFTCAITYDPFVEMERHDKRYGYVIALWELGKTVPSLFRELSEYKARHRIATTSLWTALMDPSYLPWPLRRLLWWAPGRDGRGDLWNMCHFWSNFEIADLDFFRSPQYRDIFHFLDENGGFYYERWGDAPVHSLAAAMLLRPHQVHHFADFGYVHETFQYCPYAPTARELKRGELVPNMRGQYLGHEDLGCKCKCNPAIKMIGPTCFNRIRRTVM